MGGGEAKRVVTPSAIVLAACRQVDLLVENYSCYCFGLLLLGDIQLSDIVDVAI